MFDSLQPHRLQDARSPCPSPTPRACSNSCPSSQWCHPTISSSVVPFSSCLQSFPASGSFPMSQFFSSGGQSTGISASASLYRCYFFFCLTLITPELVCFSLSKSHWMLWGIIRTDFIFPIQLFSVSYWCLEIKFKYVFNKETPVVVITLVLTVE